jgi:hypothetical protein
VFEYVRGLKERWSWALKELRAGLEKEGVELLYFI